MNLENFYKRYYNKNGFRYSNILISTEHSKDILWTIFNNQFHIKNGQLDFTIMIKKKLPKDFLKNL